MNEISARIATVIEKSGLTKTAFGGKINVSQSHISRIANGETIPSDRTISDICRVFNVNEVWLRTGVGEPFIPITREDEIAAFAGSVLGHGTPIQRAFISVLARTTPEEWALFEKKLIELANEVEKAKKETDQ